MNCSARAAPTPLKKFLDLYDRKPVRFWDRYCHGPKQGVHSNVQTTARYNRRGERANRLQDDIIAGKPKASLGNEFNKGCNELSGTIFHDQVKIIQRPDLPRRQRIHNNRAAGPRLLPPNTESQRPNASTWGGRGSNPDDLTADRF